MTLAYTALRRRLRLESGSGEGSGSGGNGQGGGDGSGSGEGSGSGDDDDDLDGEDLTGLKEAIKKERAGRRDAERKARLLEAEKRDRDKKAQEEAEEERRKKGEWEQVAKDKDAELAKEREARLRSEQQMVDDRKINAIRFEAAKLGFHDPEEAVKLIDLAKVEVDDAKQPLDVPKIVKDLADSKKHLVKGADGGTGMPKTPGKQGNGQSYSAARSYVSQTYSPRKD